jgi:hypothetical protein
MVTKKSPFFDEKNAKKKYANKYFYKKYDLLHYALNHFFTKTRFGFSFDFSFLDKKKMSKFDFSKKESKLVFFQFL